MSGAWELPSGRAPLILRGTSPAERGRRGAVFLDRDGTLNETVPDPVTGLPESPLDVADVQLLPGVGAALAQLAGAGLALVCVSNQPAAAKGKLAVSELLAIHERVLELLSEQGASIEMSLLCPHHPEGVVAALSGPCDCRKPAPGMLLEASASLGLALSRSWIVGDTDTDVAAGRAAGARAVLLEYAGSAHKRSGDVNADFSAGGLSGALPRLLEELSA